MFTDCDAFTDGQHRFAYDGERHGNEASACACGAKATNASNAPELLTVNEDTDFAALPFATGYDLEDYPLYLQRAADVAPAPVQRTIPPHACLWVQDGESDPWSGDYRERCTVCGGTRWQTLNDARGEESAERSPIEQLAAKVRDVRADLQGETTAEWAKRMGGHA